MNKIGLFALLTCAFMIAASSPVEATHITGFSVSIPDQKVGSYNTVTMKFKLPGPDMKVLSNAAVGLTFPSGYDVSAVGNGATCSHPDIDGGWSTRVIAGQKITIARDGTGTDRPFNANPGTDFTCTYPNVRNPTTGGASSGFALAFGPVQWLTQPPSTSNVGSGGASGITFTYGTMTPANLQIASSSAFASSQHTWTFTPEDTFQSTGAARVTYPAGFDVSGATGGACTGGTIDGTFTTTASGQAVTITRAGGTDKAPAAFTCTVNGIRNPGAGTTGTYTIDLIHADGFAIDRATVTGSVISGGALTAATISADDLVAGASSTLTIGFTTANGIPANGKIGITLPAGFDASGATSASCTGIDGTTAVAATALAAVITRNADGTFANSGAVSCNLAGVINPGVSGNTGTFGFETTDSLGNQGDGIVGVTGLTLAPGELTGPSISLGSLDAGTTTTATIQFTPSNPIPTTGKIHVTFPTGFDISEASSATCSGMDGSLIIWPNGQVLALTRQGAAAEGTNPLTCTVSGIILPSVGGTTGTFNLETATAGLNTIDEVAGIAGVTLIGQFPAVTATLDQVRPAAIGPLNMKISTLVAIPADGIFVANVPSELTVQGAVECNFDGTAITKNKGTTLFVIRSSDGTPFGPGILNCAVTVENPATAGTTGPLTFRTENGIGEVLEQGSANGLDIIKKSKQPKPKPTSYGTAFGHDSSTTDGASDRHDLQFEGRTAVQRIQMDLDEPGQVTISTRTFDEVTEGLPDGYESTVVKVDITKVRGPDGKFTVTMGEFSVDDFVELDRLVVLHGKDGTWMPLDTGIERNGDKFSLTFVTTDFSPFVVAIGPAGGDQNSDNEESADEKGNTEADQGGETDSSTAEPVNTEGGKEAVEENTPEGEDSPGLGVGLLALALVATVAMMRKRG